MVRGTANRLITSLQIDTLLVCLAFILYCTSTVTMSCHRVSYIHSMILLRRMLMFGKIERRPHLVTVSYLVAYSEPHLHRPWLQDFSYITLPRTGRLEREEYFGSGWRMPGN